MKRLLHLLKALGYLVAFLGNLLGLLVIVTIGSDWGIGYTFLAFFTFMANMVGLDYVFDVEDKK